MVSAAAATHDRVVPGVLAGNVRLFHGASMAAAAPAARDHAALAAGVLAGKRGALSRAITLVESTREDHRREAQRMLDTVLAARREKETAAGDGDGDVGTFRVGIAGPPGAGKSTFIEALGLYLLDGAGALPAGARPGDGDGDGDGDGAPPPPDGVGAHSVAVLAIDPSSSVTGGSILGDKTRMQRLSAHPRAYVRPSPTGGALGGVAEHTNDVALLCESAGFDVTLVETVGLGQSEVLVDTCVDMLVLVLPPAGGDELQGIKKGIMEMADLVVVNKADGDLAAQARHAASAHRRALQLTRRKVPEWAPRVQRMSALEGGGVARVWDTCARFRAEARAGGRLRGKRARQANAWMWSQVRGRLVRAAERDAALNAAARACEAELAAGHLSPRLAAERLVDGFLGRRGAGR